MITRRTTTDVPFTAEQMFDLVADVEKYPEFLPHCLALRVVSNKVKNGEGLLVADMIVAYKVFREKFRSSVTLDKPDGLIDIDYADGPFRHLDTLWRFTDKPEGGSTIDFEIEFEFSSILLQTTAQLIFDKAFAKMSDAFVDRAFEVYPEPASL